MSPRQPSTPDADSGQKTTLFCPGCGHESDVTGDWTVRTKSGRRTYDCPACNTTITKRLRERPLLPPND